ncbi:non-ribosomal peptide synthetase, partial [Pyxidicoccus caerfyrddinensis]|uniref:non-ribosomal peptide synthetase n=1 Tax=Pyxidicoccus caerfyrddinensis TaxID=2709663 RepID=UPI0013DABCB9
ASTHSLLARYSGQDDIVVGSPIAGRRFAQLEGLIGFFVNTLALRARLTPGLTFRELLAQVKESTLGAYAHQDVPFEKLVEALQPQRDMSRTPLFQVMLVLQNAPPPASADTEELSVLPVEQEGIGAKFDLTFTFTHSSQGLVGSVSYSTALFREDTVRRLVTHLRMLLQGVVARPETSLSELPLLDDAERHQLLREWNGAHAEYPADACLHTLIEAQVERTPDAVALCFEGESLTYRQLDTRANQLAWHLRSLGVGPEVRVGLFLERSLELVVALLATLKAGGAYVPFDPDYPAQRLAWMLEDARPVVLLALQRLLSRLPAHGARLLCLDSPPDSLALQPRHAPPPLASADALAYVIFTSGSTGRPKGAMNSHRGVVNRLLWGQQEYGLSAADTVLQKTPFSFDVSVWEFFWPLLTGARLVLARPGGHQEPDYLVRLIAQEGITTLHFVPSMLQVFLEEPELERCNALQRVMCSGEALPLELAQRCLQRLPSADLHNLYGPTEAAVEVTYYACVRDEPHRSVPIGRPVANTQIRILDVHLRPVPIGVPGELFIGGVQVGRGYLGRPELTAERFIPDPFSDTPGARLYRTGDVARWLPDGLVEYLGRADFQVKVRGLRIELGEIESALQQQHSVQQAVVLAREDRAGDKRLVAYVVGRGGTQAVEVSALRARLHEKLPEYMVPQAFVVLEAFPLTPSGKVDRKALPAPEAPSGSAAYVAPRTPTEEILASLWAGLLRTEKVSVEDDFFALGGHSLLATQVVSRVRSALGVELPLRALFEAPTVAALAARIDSSRESATGLLAPSIVPVPRTGPLPLSFAQQRLWFIDQLEPGGSSYSIPRFVRMEGPLDVAALHRAFEELVRRHEALRTTFTQQDGQPLQLIASHAELPLELEDLSGLEPEAAREELQRRLREDTLRPFDLATGPLVRAGLWKLGPAQHVLSLNLHHIVSDGWSTAVLVREVAALYDAYVQGRPSPLPPLPIQYADYAVWQRQWLQGAVLEAQLAWWQQQLAGLTLLQLPTDKPRPPVQTFRGAQVPAGLSLTTSDTLKALCQQEGATPFMLLLGAFQVLLARYSGQQDISVGSPVAGRQ